MSGEAALRLRIVTADFYSAPPVAEFDETYNHFRGSVIKLLPVIRIFGITPTGEKVCLHLHGVYPYIYVPYPASVPKGKENSLLYEVADSLDEALNNSFGSKKHHVFKVSTVSAKSFYGYHSKEECFLKISFYHPSSIKRGVTLLQSGAVCNQPFQPHEAHIPYILQFFIDYNLYGMNFLSISQWRSRTDSKSSDNQITFLPKETTCDIEVDAHAGSILNIQSSTRVLNPGLAYIREEEEQRNEEDGVSKEERSQSDSRQFGPSASDCRFREQLELALKERYRLELSNQGTQSLSQSSSASQHQAPVTFDHEDMSVLKMIFGRLVGDNLPDEDSILGFTPEQENPDEHDQDLSQPYTSFMMDLDEENTSAENDCLSETLVWPELDGLSQIEADSPPMFVDGNMDDEKTPEKASGKTEPQNSPRYIPLDVKLHKSPRQKKSVQHPASPELFKRLEENASSLRNIISPNRKVEKKQCEFIHSTGSSTKDYGDIDIIGDSDNSENEVSEAKVNFSLIENTSKLKFDKTYTKNKTNSAKKVLFKNTLPAESLISEKSSSVIGKEETSIRNEVERGLNTENIAERISESTSLSIEDDKASVEDVPESCSPEYGTQLKRSEEPILKDYSVCEHTDLDSAVNYSQCTITSFYGDTTMCLSPFSYSRVLMPLINPPTNADISASLHLYGLEKIPSEAPFYGDPMDLSTSKEVGFNVISLSSKFGNDLEEFRGTFNFSWPTATRQVKRIVILEPAMDPPSSVAIRKELEMIIESSSLKHRISSTQDSNQGSHGNSKDSQLLFTHKSKLRKQKVLELDRRKRLSGEIEHATPNNSGMFKIDFQNLQDAQMNSLHKFTTLMVLELHANTRGDLRPDPEYDAVEAVFYVISNDAPSSTDDSQPPPRQTGVIMVCPEDEPRCYPFSCSVVSVDTEKELFFAVEGLVVQHNPDIIAGFEIEMLSWGYLIERGFVLGINMITQLSRLKSDSERKEFTPNAFTNKDYDLRIPGRIVLNVWRLMRHEVALQSYTFENVAYHILHTRIPKFSFKTLTCWWNYILKCHRYLVLKYYMTKVDGIEKILDQLNLIGRTGELASLFGIQFYEVFSRGSQFRVESMMLRPAKRFGFIAVSPNVEQRANMRAPESLPLIMEPESRFYSDPVIVLDFQSLYPSMIIAYNYCFSTCLGRVSCLMETSQFKFGCTELEVPLKELLKLQKNLHVSPAGVAFVDKSIRHGVLPQMLEEILQTRLMVKASLKRHKSNKLLSRVLDARQLGLKLIANVTYGYTSANFSGRMPCIEVGDSVVSKGRETLERAIQQIEKEAEWRARVVYGDTDSMFVLCPGRTREEAFAIGQQIADRVTASNPSPVKLKLEKVYQPCILQTKKRYVGFMYESPDQEKPEFDAKGIETVRRDGCPAASKILEKSLKLLFESKNMSIVKGYVKQQMMKVLSGRLNPAELAFAKEYRGVSGYQPNAPVPALKIAKQMVQRDRRAEPRTSERVPYVVVCGPPGLPLIALTRSLSEFLSDPAYVLNADYYISKAILPPLDRCFCLLGADVFSWYSGLPKKQLLNLHTIAPNKRKATIAQYFRSVQCLACGVLTPLTLCQDCQLTPSHSLSLLSQNIGKLERKYHILQKICGSCCGRNYETDCISLDCPVFFRRHQAKNDKMQTNILYTTIAELSQF